MSNPHEAAMPARASATPKYAWTILAVVFFLSIVIPMQWFSCPPLKMNIFAAYGLEGAARASFGLLMSYLSTTALIAAIVAGPLANKVGHKIVLIIASVCLIGGCSCAALSGTDFNILLASRIITGAGVGLAAVTASAVIAIWFPGKTRATAMAIWSTWVPVGMLIVFNAGPVIANAGGLHMVWWIICALAVIALVLIIAFYRAPREDEAEISVKKSTLREALPFLKSRQLVALGVAWLGFNYVNYCFTTYNVDFFQTGMGMDQTMAALIGSIASACGIIAPLFGAISDRINKDRKYLMIVLGCLALLLAALFGFENSTVFFWAYLVFQILGNAILVAACRPMAPMIVGRGGATAVTYALAIITILQYLGQMFVFLCGTAIDAFGFTSMAAWTSIAPVAAVCLIASFFIKPAKRIEQGEKPQAE